MFQKACVACVTYTYIIQSTFQYFLWWPFYSFLCNQEVELHLYICVWKRQLAACANNFPVLFLSFTTCPLESLYRDNHEGSVSGHIVMVLVQNTNKGTLWRACLYDLLVRGQLWWKAWLFSLSGQGRRLSPCCQPALARSVQWFYLPTNFPR